MNAMETTGSVQMKTGRIGSVISAAAAMTVALLCGGCDPMAGRGDVRTFGQDVAFLQEHVDVVTLGDPKQGPCVAVVPQWQGRVATSSPTGNRGEGVGWLNYDLIASGVIQPHINVYGGEDRFWMGPEGGQYAIFFKPGDPFDLEHWQTPADIDTVAYQVTDQDDRHVTFKHRCTIVNYAGTRFDVGIERTIRLLGPADTSALGVDVGEHVKTVAYQSENKMTNLGSDPWTRNGGLLSIWILGMYKKSPRTTVVIPFEKGDAAVRGRLVNDRYFGKVPVDRLQIADGVMFFKADGQYRSKIGISPRRAKSVLGSYDATRKLLTIVEYTLPGGVTDYVNSMWELQKDPYGGDVVNSYNDGPPEPGTKPLGPFYELETSSPAAQLGPGQALHHIHRTFHFQGPEDELDVIARGALGVDLETIKTALPQ